MSGLTICLVALAGLGAGPLRQALQPVPLVVPDGMSFTALAFSPDGAFLAIAGPHTRESGARSLLVQWRTDTGKTEACSPIAPKAYASLAYTHDGKWLVGLAPHSDEQVSTWGPNCRPAGAGYVVQFDESSNRIYGAADGRVMWCAPGELGGCAARPKDGIAQKTFRRITLVRGLYSGAISPDGKLWAHLNHQDIDLYIIAARKRARSLLGQRGRVRAVAFCPDGERLASISHRQDDSGSSHTLVSIWGVANGKRHLAVELRPGLKGTGVALSATGLVAVLGQGKEGSAFLRVLDAASGAEVARPSFPGEAGEPKEVAFSRDGKYLAVCLSRAVRLWRVSGKERP
jgi:WD40 repeat protein